MPSGSFSQSSLGIKPLKQSLRPHGYRATHYFEKFAIKICEF